MFGALEFYTAAKEHSLNPIVGCEFYLAPESRKIKKPGREGELRYHQVLLAKNLVGYRNLSWLCSESYLTGFYYKPRVDKDLLHQYHEGIICLSSCLQGEIPQLLLHNRIDDAYLAAKFYQELYAGDFYIELMRHNLSDQERLVPLLLQLAEDLHIESAQHERKGLKVLPRSCDEAADNLEKDRKLYEAQGVFPKRLIDKTIEKLKAYGDKNMHKIITQKAEVEKLMAQYLHYG